MEEEKKEMTPTEKGFRKFIETAREELLSPKVITIAQADYDFLVIEKENLLQEVMKLRKQNAFPVMIGKDFEKFIESLKIIIREIPECDQRSNGIMMAKEVIKTLGIESRVSMMQSIISMSKIVEDEAGKRYGENRKKPESYEKNRKKPEKPGK